MKRMKRRAYSALIVALCLLFGIGIYVYRFSTQSENWVNFTANKALYSNGSLVTGVITDCNGTILADSKDGNRIFAEDEKVRTACLHIIGDKNGNIATGVMNNYRDLLSKYNPLSGLSDRGSVLTLSIDSTLCCTAYEAFAGRNGTFLLMDYTTGKIIAMTSSISYDPDAGFDIANPKYDGVYLNRGIRASYTPGSVFKLVTLAAAIENIDDLAQRTFTCSGSVIVDGNEVNCTGIHGTQTIGQAFSNSCNCAFAELSLELGGELLHQYADSLGFTSPLSIGRITTIAGNFDASENGTADLAWSGIGQSTDLICPFALLRYVAAIANSGNAADPTLLQDDTANETRIISAETAAMLKQMMLDNVSNAYGSSSFPGLPLGGKTGTAETGNGTSHSWFTGFLNDTEHPYAFVAFIENGGSGLRNAGLLANTVLQEAVKK